MGGKSPQSAATLGENIRAIVRSFYVMLLRYFRSRGGRIKLGTLFGKSANRFLC